MFPNLRALNPDVRALRSDVVALCKPGDRLIGGPGHAAARRHLLARLQALGLDGFGGRFAWSWTGEGERFTNLLARLPGADPSLDPILIGAHYDTCGRQPGADDNAAAVAILLACVAPLRAAGLRRDVIFALFDSEEPPWFLTEQMGSVRFYEHQRQGPIHFALIMDLCGHDVPIPGREELLFITGMESDPLLEPLVQSADALPDLRVVAVLNRYVGDMSDHFAFREDGRPYLFLSCGRWRHYHMPTDTPDRLNYQKMARIRDAVVHLMAGAAASDLQGPTPGYDPVATEAALLTAHLGPLLTGLGGAPRTRADVDRVVRAAMSGLGL